MALAIDASSPAAFSTATLISTTSASFTPPSGSLVLIAFIGNRASAGVDASVQSVTNTGTAVTWSRLARKTSNAASTGGAGTSGGSELWGGVGAGSAITVTVTGLGTGVGTDKWVKITVLTGADTAALANVAASFNVSGLPSVAVPGNAVGSYVFAVSSDWSQAGLGTAGTSQTIVSEYDNAGQITGHLWRTTNVLAGAGSQTMNLTAPAAENYNECAIEIKDVSGGTPALPPIIVLAPRR